MQVKKYEAKTMKEALQMVKQELGPEAIILSAKDNKKSFGLAGGGSIEITAAISEKSLGKKQYVENRMPEKSKERFRTQSAKDQKAFIENTLTRRHRNSQLDPRIGQGAVAQRPLTTQRYIDIEEEEARTSELNGRRVDDLLAEFAHSRAPATYVRPVPKASDDEVFSLRKEVEALRELLSQIQSQSQKGTMTRHPGAEYGLPFELAGTYEKLDSAGIDSRYVVEIMEKANSELTATEKKKKSLVDGWVARYILNNVKVVGSWIKPNSSKVHLFFGPGGSGKTTALVKVASQLVFQERKKVAILTTDNFKIGAVDQLKIYSQILNIPFEVVRHTIEFPQVIRRFEGFDAILVDYPGLSLKDIQEIDQVRSLTPSLETPPQAHLVLSCTMNEMDAYETCHRYRVVNFDDIIVTRLDESSNHGFLFNVQRKTEKPLYGFGLGPKIPEDMELATRERVLDLIFKITKR